MEMNQIFERIKAPTPRFFRALRNIGLTLAGIGTVLLTAPVTLPAVLVTVGGYMVTAGGVATAVSQLANTEDDFIGEKTKPNEDGTSSQ